ncbi:MAG: trypsin-like peptidase domain-containing protein [Oligoflexia bacterium]|nr:trypsin-like peptidase domain-containing protein [Oligoflexia bacterium]
MYFIQIFLNTTIFLFFFLTSNSWAQKLMDLKLTPEIIYQKRVHAVVKISIYEKNGITPISHGTGTFVSKNGLLITNLHVAKYLFHPDYSVEITNFENKELPNIIFIDCSDKRQIDLCLFKSPLPPKAWFHLSDDVISLGYNVYKIGHAEDLEYNLTKGLTLTREANIPFLLDYRTSENTNVEFIEVSALLRPGDSGGPIFDLRGNLIAITTMRISEMQDRYITNRFLAISAREVYWYVQKNKSLIDNHLGKNYPLITKDELKGRREKFLKENSPPSTIALIKNITRLELQKHITQQEKHIKSNNKKNNLIIIDVRDPFEYSMDHIHGAINIPYIEKSKNEINFIMGQDQFDINQLKKIIKNKEDTIVVYCNGGISWKSYKAIITIKRLTNFENILWFKDN